MTVPRLRATAPPTEDVADRSPGPAGPRHGAPQGHVGGPVAGDLARVADLLAEAAEILRNRAREGDIQLAACPERALMDGMPDAPASPPATVLERPAPGPGLLSVEDVAVLLGVKPRTIRRWREAGKMPPAVHFGGVVRWRPEVVDAWLAEQEEPR